MNTNRKLLGRLQAAIDHVQQTQRYPHLDAAVDHSRELLTRLSDECSEDWLDVIELGLELGMILQRIEQAIEIERRERAER